MGLFEVLRLVLEGEPADPDPAGESEAAGEPGTADDDPAPPAAPDPADLPEPRASAVAAATAFVDAWPDADLDRTPASLSRLDALVDEQWSDGRFDDAELGGDDRRSETFTTLVERLGAYLGEVLVRATGGEWVDHDEVGVAVRVRGPDATGIVAVQRVAAESLRNPARFADAYAEARERVGLADGDATDPLTTGDAPSAGAVGPTLRDAVDGDPTPDALDEALRAAAADLVAAYPGHDLDYAPASLSRLDALVERAFRGGDANGASDPGDPPTTDGVPSPGDPLADDAPDAAPGGTASGPAGVDRVGDERAVERVPDGDGVTFGTGGTGGAGGPAGTDPGDDGPTDRTEWAVALGGYLATTYAREAGARWATDGGPLLVVPGPDGEARFDPVAVADDCLAGDRTFAAVHDTVRDGLGG
jgi:hypothetical protein